MSNLSPSIQPSFDNATWNEILSQATAVNAQDVFLEMSPSQQQATVRFRIEGNMSLIGSIPIHQYDKLINDLVARGALNNSELNEQLQSGTSTWVLPVNDTSAEYVSQVVAGSPSHGDQTYAMLRLNPTEGHYQPLDSWLDASQARQLQAVMDRPTGLVVIAGTTGQGKTMMLNNLLGSCDPSKHMTSLEDPLVQRFAGRQQIDVSEADVAEILQQLQGSNADIIAIDAVPHPAVIAQACLLAQDRKVLLTVAGGSSQLHGRVAEAVADSHLVYETLDATVRTHLFTDVCPHCAVTETVTDQQLQEIFPWYSFSEPAQQRKILRQNTQQDCQYCDDGRQTTRSMHPFTVDFHNIPANERAAVDEVGALNNMFMQELLHQQLDLDTAKQLLPINYR